ncbi:MAG: tetratricopeptide repeat protein [Chitinispirillaceae bacterium]|nr:tetratricopeptide repeat protein [Chitinispirillaceae bacterium]
MSIQTTLLLAWFAVAVPAERVDWLLKDAFEEEFIALSEVSVVTPAQVRYALEQYEAGNYRKSIEVLEKVRALKLPDGRLDFTSFVLGESYRQNGSIGLARQEYSFVVTTFPLSDKTPAAYYRLLEFAVREDDIEKADDVHALFKKHFAAHPLHNAVKYQYAVLFYRRSEYEKAAEVLGGIGEKSARYLQSRFLLALCQLQLGDYTGALLSLEQVRKNGPKGEMVNEAVILIGDCYFMEGNPAAALGFYEQVPKDARRHHYALVKAARTRIDLGRNKEAMKMSKSFLERNRKSRYYFEMASVLEQAYSKMGRDDDARKIGTLIHRQIMDARLGFEIYQEIDNVNDLMRSWLEIEHQAIRRGNRTFQDRAAAEMERLHTLEKQLYALLKSVVPAGAAGSGETVPYHAERRYLALLKARMSMYDDTLAAAQKHFESVMALLKDNPADTAVLLRADSLSRCIDTVKQHRRRYADECDLVLSVCIGSNDGAREADEDLQAKFVDWAFIKYQEKKDELRKINLELSERKRAAAQGQDGAEPGMRKESDAGGKERRVPAEEDRIRQSRLILEERLRLTEHIKTIIDVYPRGAYTPAILFRLAELYFDAAGDDFQDRLRAYEQRMAEGKDSAGAEFPEYRLDSVIATYDRIIDVFPYSDVADGAHFYKALALQKMGKEEEGNAVLLSLIRKYPESRYYVEANMIIGRYYFDHPKVEKGQGYKLAEDAYRRVLYFRKHPEYVSALYHLGWCYYMQDRYDEAIAVFKYLIEEASLDFDPSRKDEKQIANPLLRGEAIDYIAISFDAKNKVDEAIQFLKLVGNQDYAALVLKRIGELREEDLDFATAISVYRRLLAEYPKSRDAPLACVSLIRLYDSRDRHDSAMVLREEFFSRYAQGGEWQDAAAGKDTVFARSVDSMAIVNGLYVADESYRRAEVTRDRDAYAAAAGNYRRLVERYRGDPRVVEAHWNLAVLLDAKLNDKPQAFDRYKAFSRLENVERPRREQAALNAVGIAQALLPEDSAVTPGTVDFAAAKVVEAVENYTKQFPDGTAWGKVMLGLGAIYFNRHLFTNAAKLYGQIIAKGAKNADYFEALAYLGQCHFGEENWPAAITAFEKVIRESGDDARKDAAKKMLLQAEFLNAKRFFGADDFAAAATLFRAIDDKHPGSEYGDVALFNAAEAHERLKQWDKACDRYVDIVKRYPLSKLVPDALLNAAGDYEKINKYDKAADAYEKLAADYAWSDKAKDALFNVGFCYEKLGKPEKMADANERYSARYPGEKDVEAMLLRSAAFYMKASMWDRALSVYRNFVRRYPHNPKSIEAYFMIAKCSYDQGDKVNALLGFNQAEQQNQNLAKQNSETNNYYAAEAAYHSGLIQREKMLSVKLKLPEEVLKTALKEKSDLLADAVKAFQRVMQYRSERMFEAAFRVGELYEDLAMAWKDQERPSLDPINAAVREKEILSLSAALLQKSFIPYEKALELARGLDSLGTEQRGWVEKAEKGFKKNMNEAGFLMKEAVSSMSSAPVPKEIRDKPLHFFQYQKQLLEALTPMREQVRDYFAGVLSLSDSFGLKGAEIDSCRSDFAKANFSIGDGFDRLSSLILRNAKEVAKDLPQEEREDLLFQLEDIVFELQDKAIFAYEDGLKAIGKRGLQENRWAKQIVGNLARLSPDKYGSAYFVKAVAVSNGTWIARSDSVEGWCGASPPQTGWQLADTVSPRQAQGFNDGSPRYIGAVGDAPACFLWKFLFLSGAPRSAALYVSTPDRYRFFVNGSLVLSDSIGSGKHDRIDSAAGIVSMLHGGDNTLCAEMAAAGDEPPRIAVVFSAMIDTSERYASSVKLPPPLAGMKLEGTALQGREAGAPAVRSGRRTVADSTMREAASNAARYRTAGELHMAIDNYYAREAKIAREIKKERIEIQRMRMENDSLGGRLRQVRAEIDSLRAKKGTTGIDSAAARQTPPPSDSGKGTGDR